MYLSVIFFPFFSFLFLLFGRFLTKIGAVFFSLSLVFFSFFFSCLIFYEVSLCNSPCFVDCLVWFNTDYVGVKWFFFFDTLTAIMLLVITFISFLVHLYSIDYMSSDPFFIRFFSYLSLFTFFMLLLVTSGNFFQMFLGWEGVGVTSFLLINFWFTRVQANKAALKAMLLNRFGDFGLILSIFFIFNIFCSVDYGVVFLCTNYFVEVGFPFLHVQLNILDLIALLIFIGVVGKSAQIGLHTWLPDAMEGPTPVSALLHAATMVTAGVFLLIRCSFIFEFSSFSLPLIAFMGALTAFISSTIGILQYDIKKVVAYSTCSQLGYMVFSCGLSNYSVAIFHLFNHAFFKALLFLSMGSIIHSLLDEQDLRRMGSFLYLLPFVYSSILIGNLALIGFPFLTGFFSKDFILELAFSHYASFSFFSYCLGLFAAFFTTVYSFRLFFFIFFTRANFFKIYLFKLFEAGYFIYISLFLLSFCSIFFGYIFKDMFIGLGTPFFTFSILIFLENNFFIEAEEIFFLVKLFPIVVVILGFFSSIPFFFDLSLLNLRIKFFFFYKFVYLFINRLWFFDLFYNNYFVKIFLHLNYYYYFKGLDKGVLEFFFFFKLTKLIYEISIRFSLFQSGYIYDYLFLIFFNVILILFFFSDVFIQDSFFLLLLKSYFS